MDNYFDLINLPSKQYPNRVLNCTKDSDTVIKMKIAESELKKHGGVSFYCRKRHEYVYIIK